MSERAKNRWLAAAEVGLVVAIVGLLVATWLPAMIGASPDEPPAGTTTTTTTTTTTKPASLPR